jgi:2'-5' RNA ligase
MVSIHHINLHTHLQGKWLLSMNNLFLGIPISHELSIHFIQLIIKNYPNWQNHSALRWTSSENQHLTLHFFGSLDLERLHDFRQDLPNYLKECQRFTVLANQLFNFPKTKSDLLAAYVELSTSLAQLYQVVQKAVSAHQLPMENRPYFPHITLCRSRRPGLLKMQPIQIHELILVNKMTLFQTQNTPEGSIYSPIENWFL